MDKVEQARFDEAVRSLVNRPLLASQDWQEQQWLANRQGAHPAIVQFERGIVQRAARLGIPLYAHWVVRPYEEQLRLFHEGKSKDSPKDGLWPHMAFAVDIVHSERHWNLTQKEWLVIHHLGTEAAKAVTNKLEWGGNWKFYDPAHWQIKDWKAIVQGDPKWLRQTKRS